MSRCMLKMQVVVFQKLLMSEGRTSDALRKVLKNYGGSIQPQTTGQQTKFLCGYCVWNY